MAQYCFMSFIMFGDIRRSTMKIRKDNEYVKK